MSRARRQRVLIIVENVSLARDHRLRKQVASLTEAKFGVTVICRRDPDNAAVEGVRLLEYRPPRDARSRVGYVAEYLYSVVMATVLTARALVRPGFDVVQLCGAPDIYFPLAWALRPLGKRVVYDQRDPSPETYVARYGPGRSPMLTMLELFERRTYEVADHVFTVNSALRNAATTRGGVPPDRVSVVGNGPVLASVHQRPDVASLKRGRPFMCLWHGLMGRQDHVDIAVKVIARAVHDHGRRDCLLVLAGDGEARQECERLADALGVGEHVFFAGWLGEEEIFRYLSAADVAIEPNLEHFVSPVKIFESMAFGVPVVAFDLAATRELAGDAAVYAPPGDEAVMARLLVALLDDPEQRSRRGDAGRDRIRDELAWDRQQSRYLAAYRAVLDTPAGRAAQRPVAARSATDSTVPTAVLPLPPDTCAERHRPNPRMAR